MPTTAHNATSSLTIVALIAFLTLGFATLLSAANIGHTTRPDLASAETFEDSAKYVSTAINSIIGNLSESQQEVSSQMSGIIESDELRLIREHIGQSIHDALDAYAQMYGDSQRLEECVEVQQCSLREILELSIERNNLLNRLPTTVPCEGRLTSTFGSRIHPISHREKHHDGLDIATTKGSPIYSAGTGTVVFAGRRHGYGNVIEIDHGFGYHTIYAHASKLLVTVGDEITRGQEIALVGSTGRSTGPHLHFEVVVDDQKVDPAMFVSIPTTEDPALLASGE